MLAILCRYFSSVLFILVTLTLPAIAQVTLQQDALIYQGQIDKSNNQQVFQLYEQAVDKPTKLEITSGGGNVDLAMDLAEFVIKHQLDVIVPSFCFSSCANYVFIAGKHKWLADKAILGWHGNAASARWLDADIDAMVSNQSARDRDKQWQQLRHHYDLVIAKASQRETALLKTLNVNPRLLTLGHEGKYITLAKQQNARGWTVPIGTLTHFGVNRVHSLGQEWQPQTHPRFPLLIIETIAPPLN